MMSMNLMTKTAAMNAVLHPVTRVTMMYAAVLDRGGRGDSEVRQEKQVPLELQELPEIQVSPALRALPDYLRR